ncbi:hypothetical protein BpHYR1_019082 [Brachionus plicatilis]|uniref:Uncharacterized protein n=1 Tax=Brachionus plicatilis TaxID=10195 RepID=A0A3M7RZ14_BRAPC|nr:hypothetical protein BpHYR1_019082 [Brachionus plicatilis]
MSYSIKTNSSKTAATKYTNSDNYLDSNNFQEDLENYLQNKFFYTRITHSQKTKCSSETCQTNSPHEMRLI